MIFVLSIPGLPALLEAVLAVVEVAAGVHVGVAGALVEHVRPVSVVVHPCEPLSSLYPPPLLTRPRELECWGCRRTTFHAFLDSRLLSELSA